MLDFHITMKFCTLCNMDLFEMQFQFLAFTNLDTRWVRASKKSNEGLTNVYYLVI